MGRLPIKVGKFDWEEETKKNRGENSAKLISMINYMRAFNTLFFNNIAVNVHELKSHSFPKNPAYWLKYLRVFAEQITDAYDLFLWMQIWKEEEGWFESQEFEQLQKLVECNLFIIVNTTVGEPIWSGKGRPYFRINIHHASILFLVK